MNKQKKRAKKAVMTPNISKAVFEFVVLFYIIVSVTSLYLFLLYRDNGRIEKTPVANDPCKLESRYKISKRSSEEKIALRTFCDHKDVQTALTELEGSSFDFNGCRDSGKCYFQLYIKHEYWTDYQTIYFEVDPSSGNVTPKFSFLDDFEIYNSEEPNFVNIPNTNITLEVPKKYSVSSDLKPGESTVVLTGADLSTQLNYCTGEYGMARSYNKYDWEFCKYILFELTSRGLDRRALMDERLHVAITLFESELDAEEWTMENLLFQGQTLRQVIEDQDYTPGEYLQLGNKRFYAKERKGCSANDFVYVYSTTDVNGQSIIVQFLSREGRSTVLEDVLSTMVD